MIEEILTVQEVAKLLKLADKSVYMVAQRGNLPAFKIGGLWQFRRQSLDAWINERVGWADQVSTSATKGRAKVKLTRKGKAQA